MKKSHLIPTLFLSAALLLGGCKQATTPTPEEPPIELPGEQETPEPEPEPEVTIGGCDDGRCATFYRATATETSANAAGKCYAKGCDSTQSHVNLAREYYGDEVRRLFLKRDNSEYHEEYLDTLNIYIGSRRLYPCYSDEDISMAYMAAMNKIDDIHAQLGQ